ncbi:MULTISPECIES: ABC transporter permease [unclassified Pseudofrankia]|uniref:ABC transporter permease n=1 Tax=unclassified Pseudofrankia TaxID=2994372 RepID=UPI0008D92E74|nr:MULTISPECIES: FtsX-like permease family protein [unclassified Pseudofrankia]MDT3444714.1 FtsX-like permease family protein [Pseudofrankia sp. BMG5.37]OHV50353.1 hypothetical protein BCD48_10755 [Pseudofrankia sp. BMG5.36]
MLRATLRSLLARKLRLLLSALAVVAGVSFVSGTLVLTDTLNATFTSLFAGITKNVSVDVRAVNKVDPTSDDGRSPLPASLVDGLRAKFPKVAVVGQVRGKVAPLDPATDKSIAQPTTPAIAINWTGGQPTSVQEIATGRAPNADGEVVVDKATADRYGFQLNQKIAMDVEERPAFTLVGTFRMNGQDGLAGTPVTAFTLADAQRLMLKPDQFSAVYLASNDVSQEELARQVAAAPLPPDVEAITGHQLADENATAVRDGLAFLSTALLIFAGISVFVGAFIIFNTFTMLVAQRVRELALMRAIGASRRQVQVSVQVEAALIGFFGATAGLVCGVALAALLQSALGAFGVELPTGAMVFRPRTAVVSYLVGVLVTSAAAVVPAHKAATVPPIAALRDSYTIAARSLRMRALAGVTGALLGAGAVVVGLSRPGSSGTPLVGVGAVMIFLGVTALSPVLARPVTRVIGAALPALFGVVGRIGLQNAMRNPRRTASTASALMIGLALVSAFAIFGQSIKVSVKDTVTNSVGADYLMFSPGFATSFSPRLGQTVAKQPGVTVAAISGGFAAIADRGTSDSFWAGDPAAISDLLKLKVTSGDIHLREGQVAIDETTATKIGARVGSPVKITFSNGQETLTLAATFAGGGIAPNALLTQPAWVKHAAADENFLVLVKRGPNADPATVRSAIDAAAKAVPSVNVYDQSEFIAEQSKQVDQILGLVYVLLALAVLIALFGIVNTLALSVIERTREIGLLRAVGLRRGQMWVVIVLESVVIALFGAALGVGVGSFLGWALVTALKSQGITSFAYPTATIVVVLILGGVLGVAAAVFPALRAARMNVLRAISTA